MNNLPNSIKKIKFDIKSQYNKKLNNLPIGLEYLELGEYFDNPIINIRSNLLTIKCSKNYKYISNYLNMINVHTY